MFISHTRDISDQFDSLVITETLDNIQTKYGYVFDNIYMRLLNITFEDLHEQIVNQLFDQDQSQ